MTRRALPPSVGKDHLEALYNWLEMFPEDEAEETYELKKAAADDHAVRSASKWGPCLITLLVGQGYLEPGGDPLEALSKVCCKAMGEDTE